MRTGPVGSHGTRPLPSSPHAQHQENITTCIRRADQSMIGQLIPQRETASCPVRRFSRKARHPHRDALPAVYTTYKPEGTGLAVLRHVSASVASAPRGGVACNDAAIRQDEPIIGWVRDARAHALANEKGKHSQ